jgi:hypothetical protein
MEISSFHSDINQSAETSVGDGSPKVFKQSIFPGLASDIRGNYPGECNKG